MIDYHFGCYLMQYLDKSIEELCENLCEKEYENIQVGVVLVATKCTFWLPLVIKNILNKIKNCKLYFFGSKDSICFLKESISYNNISFHIIDDFNDIKYYNRLLLNKDFWNTFKEEYVLITQPDCIILRDINLSDLQFDYIGAICGMLNENFIMNGGLSIRNKNVMIQICDNLSDEQKTGNIAEDIIFSNIIAKNSKYKSPSANDCLDFSIETIGNIDKVLGIHGTDKFYIHPLIKKQFIDNYIRL